MCDRSRECGRSKLCRAIECASDASKCAIRRANGPILCALIPSSFHPLCTQLCSFFPSGSIPQSPAVAVFSMASSLRRNHTPRHSGLKCTIWNMLSCLHYSSFISAISKLIKLCKHNWKRWVKIVRHRNSLCPQSTTSLVVMAIVLIFMSCQSTFFIRSVLRNFKSWDHCLSMKSFFQRNLLLTFQDKLTVSF